MADRRIQHILAPVDFSELSALGAWAPASPSFTRTHSFHPGVAGSRLSSPVCAGPAPHDKQTPRVSQSAPNAPSTSTA